MDRTEIKIVAILCKTLFCVFYLQVEGGVVFVGILSMQYYLFLIFGLLNTDDSGTTYEGLQCKTRYIHFVKFSGQAAQTLAFMAFCIGAQTLNGILTAIYLDLSNEILPRGAGRENKAFQQKTYMCKFGVYRVLRWSPSYVEVLTIAVLL